VARTRIGVDVGSTAVRVAEVAAGDIPVVVRAAQVPLPPGVVESGEVRQPEAVAEALRELWSMAGVTSKQVYLGVGNQRVVVREVALPWLPEKELRDTLAFRIQEFIPMASDEAVLDFDLVGEMDQGGRRMVRIMLVAAHKPEAGRRRRSRVSQRPYGHHREYRCAHGVPERDAVPDAPPDAAARVVGRIEGSVLDPSRPRVHGRQRQPHHDDDGGGDHDVLATADHLHVHDATDHDHPDDHHSAGRRWWRPAGEQDPDRRV
jgi:hypothetical protein